MGGQTEYKGFKIRLRPHGNGWTATIELCDDSLLDGPIVSVDVPPQGTAIDAMKLALDAIDLAGAS
jgi:hypothetical protein